MNILTIDVEEWFHLLDNSSTRSEKEWVNFGVRIHENMDRIFRVLEDTDTKATFFVVGWIAKTYPDIVKKIAERYEIGSHTMNHQLVWQQSPKEFRQDAESSIKLLEDIIGKKIKYFRAPGFSIRESEAWAFEILSDLGMEIDCSIFPAPHAHGGLPKYGQAVPKIIQHGASQIKELPIGAKEIRGRHLIFSGGGYFRLLPYWMINSFTRQSKEYLLAYIHPRDLDAGQPVIEGLPLKRRFKSYVGLKGAEAKFRRWLKDFDFIDIGEANRKIDWDRAPKIIL